MDRGSGPGVSNEGYDGAQGLFKNLKSIAGEAHLLPEFDMNASSKAAAEAFLDCKNGTVASQDAFFHQADMKEFPNLNIEHSLQTPQASSEITKVPSQAEAFSHTANPLGDVGQSLHQFMSNIGPMLGEMFSGPAGMIGSVINFVSELFTTIASGVGDALTEFSRAAASVAEEAWKKDIEEMSSAVGQSDPQFLDLWKR
jgi:hypothetical protein